MLPFYIAYITQEHFFTKSRGSHSATGYLEERLKNVRRRMPKIEEEPSTSSKGNAPSKGNTPSKGNSPSKFRELTEEEGMLLDIGG